LRDVGVIIIRGEMITASELPFCLQ